jgi:phage-related protein
MKALNVFLYVIIFLEAMVQLHEFKKKKHTKTKAKKKHKTTNKQRTKQNLNK